MDEIADLMVDTTVINDGLLSSKETIPPPMVFGPSLWGDMFISLDNQVQATDANAIEALKKEVRTRLINVEEKPTDKMILIDTLERLGLSYHFEQEIVEQLEQISKLGPNLENEDNDLFNTALQFRLLRQHGLDVSCGVFNRFYENNGNKFEESLGSDINDLLSLYEATSIRFHEEDVLEEALAFTLRHFKCVEGQIDSPLYEKVMRALGQYSFYRGVPRAETRLYISLYEEEKCRNELILRLAKLDFSLLQNIHKKELNDLTRWWKSLDITSRLPYTRDRIVECYFWAVALHFEPQYSFARLAVAKTTQIISLLNDTYDNCATLEELEIFTEVLQTWDINKADQIPDYMKIVYQTILSLYEDLGHEVSKQGRPYAVSYAKERMKQLGRAYLVEAKWFVGGKLPTFEDYIINGIISSTYYVILSTCFMGMECATQDVFEWLATDPLLVTSAAIMGRIVNESLSQLRRMYLSPLDIIVRESRGGRVLTPVDCYMKQYGTSKEQTIQKLLEICENAWKDVNKEWVSTTSIPRHILLRVLNVARITEATYKHGVDRYTTPENALKDDIVALFVDPITI